MSWDWAHEDVYRLVLPNWLCRTSFLKNWDSLVFLVSELMRHPRYPHHICLDPESTHLRQTEPLHENGKGDLPFPFHSGKCTLFDKLIYSKYYIVVSTTCKAIRSSVFLDFRMSLSWGHHLHNCLSLRNWPCGIWGVRVQLSRSKGQCCFRKLLKFR